MTVSIDSTVFRKKNNVNKQSDDVKSNSSRMHELLTPKTGHFAKKITLLWLSLHSGDMVIFQKGYHLLFGLGTILTFSDILQVVLSTRRLDIDRNEAES